MARTRKTGLVEDLLELGAALPLWLSLVLAAVAYGILRSYALAVVPPVTVPGQLGEMVVQQMVKTLAAVGQYLVPLLLLIGALISVLGRRKRQHLVVEVACDASGNALRTLTWREFELLVGEAFRMRGYAVTETGGGGADGGIDLRLEKNRESFLVQCKQWRAYKVSVNVVRKLYGVMAAEGAAGGFVVSSGVFTAEACTFAQGRNIELIDGAALQRMIDSARPSLARKLAAVPGAVRSPVVEPTCPRCGSPMIKRVARKGANAGKSFWGCRSYPQCKGARAAE